MINQGFLSHLSLSFYWACQFMKQKSLIEQLEMAEIEFRGECIRHQLICLASYSIFVFHF